MNSSSTLSLQAAAQELDVHYQTAYRWIRSGRLKAEMVGGRYVVGRADVAAFDAARRTPRAPAPPSAARVSRTAARVHDALVDGDATAVAKIVHRLLAEGSSMIEVMSEVFVPSLRRIGESWHSGVLSVATEHRASAIVERVLGEFEPNPRGRRRGTAVVAALSGDRHSLPTTMAAIALREANWHVHHLGSDMPADDFVHFCARHDITVAVITITSLDVLAVANNTADRLRLAGTPTIVGRPGRTLDDLVEAVRLGASEHL